MPHTEVNLGKPGFSISANGKFKFHTQTFIGDKSSPAGVSLVGDGGVPDDVDPTFEGTHHIESTFYTRVSCTRVVL
jgi:hypothetical protein